MRTSFICIVLALFLAAADAASVNMASVNEGDTFVVTVNADTILSIQVTSKSGDELTGKLASYPWFGYKFRWFQFSSGITTVKYNTESGNVVSIEIRGTLLFGGNCGPSGLSSPQYPLKLPGYALFTYYDSKWITQMGTSDELPPEFSQLDIGSLAKCIGRGVAPDYLALIEDFEPPSSQETAVVLWSREFGYPGIVYPNLLGYPPETSNTAADENFPVFTFPSFFKSRLAHCTSRYFIYFNPVTRFPWGLTVPNAAGLYLRSNEGTLTNQLRALFDPVFDSSAVFPSMDIVYSLPVFLIYHEVCKTFL